MDLKKLGIIINIRKNTLIAKSLQPPRVGEEVFDSQGNYVGKISSIFGPVNAPYFRVKLDRERKISGYLFRGEKYGR
ncbi:MAG: H/ACA ribonucleoprotein complex subunit GAR1 [Thermoplasmata archaeon]|nr:hypothetical protein [Thermoplasmata archaeon]